MVVSTITPPRQLRTMAERGIMAAHDGLTPAPGPDALTQYQTDPIGFFVDVLGERRETYEWSSLAEYAGHEWDGAVDPFVVAAKALVDSKDVALPSGTGLGKSRFAAAVLLWWVGSFKDARAFTYAPKEDQLRAFMWMEITRLWPRFKARFPTAILQDLRIRMKGGTDDTWGAIGMAVGIRAGETIATKAQGAHAEHLLLIYEETPGISYSILEAGEQTVTAPHNLRMAVGNPDNQLDALYLFAHYPTGQLKPHVVEARLSALDHPNVVTGRHDVVPGATSRESVDKRRWVGESDPRWLSRVRGLAPGQAVDALIRLEWVRAAQQRWSSETDRKILEMQGGFGLGVDVANSTDGDEAAIAAGKGAVCTNVVSFQCPDANRLGAHAVKLVRAFSIPVENVGVDSVGVGAGAMNEARRLGFELRGLNGGDRPWGAPGDEKYRNLRDQIQWTLREDLRMGLIALPPDLELTRELITATWERRLGKICVESKDEIKKRLPAGRSPNKADAVGYWNFVRPRRDVISRVAAPDKRGMTLWQQAMQELKEPEQLMPDPEALGVVLRQ